MERQKVKAKKEFKIGEVFQFGFAKLKVEKTDVKLCDQCEKCFMYDYLYNCKDLVDIIGSCEAKNREDKTDVVFVKVE